MNEDIEREQRALPDAPFAEMALLAHALESTPVRELALSLPAGAWTQESARAIVDVMRDEQDAGNPATRVAFVEALHARAVGPGDIAALMRPLDWDGSGLKVAEQNAAIVRERYDARVAILKCEAMAMQIRQRPDQARAILRVLVNDVSGFAATTGDGYVQAGVALTEAFTESAARARGAGSEAGLIVTGCHQLDNDPVGGFEAGDLVTWVMVSGHGKTAALGMIALRAAMARTGVAFISAEMARKQIGRRWAALLTGYSFTSLRTWSLSADQQAQAARAKRYVDTLPLYIDDTGTPSLAHVLTQARKLKRDHPEIGIICIDYMTLIQGTGNNFTEQYNTVVRALKRLAKELRVCIIGLVQPDAQTIERRPDGEQMPKLTDIAWCQEFRNQSDLVICGYRPGQSALRRLAPGATLNNDDDKGRFVIAKARNTQLAEWVWSWWGGGMAFNGGCWLQFESLVSAGVAA